MFPSCGWSHEIVSSAITPGPLGMAETRPSAAAPCRMAIPASAALRMQRILTRGRTASLGGILTGKLENDGPGFRKGIPQFRQLNRLHLRESLAQLRFSNPVVADHELRVGHVLWIGAAHHFGEDKVNGAGAEKHQVTQCQFGNWNNTRQPVLAEKDFPFAEQVGDVKAERSQFCVCCFNRVPKLVVSFQLLFLSCADEGIHVLRAGSFRGRTIEAEPYCRAAIDHRRTS
jgi:hypothetical protein